MIVGAILQASSFSYAQMVVARIVTGLGNGLNVRDATQRNCDRSLLTSPAADINGTLLSCGMFVCI